MSQVMNDLQIVENIPENLEQRESVINRAIDITSACMVYLAEHLCHDMVPLGDLGEVAIFQLLIISGKVFKTVFVGDEKLTNASNSLLEGLQVMTEHWIYVTSD